MQGVLSWVVWLRSMGGLGTASIPGMAWYVGGGIGKYWPRGALVLGYSRLLGEGREAGLEGSGLGPRGALVLCYFRLYGERKEAGLNGTDLGRMVG